MSRTVTEATTVFYGPIVNPKSTSSFLPLPNTLLAVAASGKIDWIEENVHPSSVQDVLARHGSLDTPLISLKYGEFILPGFIDTHTVRVTPSTRRTMFIIDRRSTACTSGAEHWQVSTRPCITVARNDVRNQWPTV